MSFKYVCDYCDAVYLDNSKVFPTRSGGNKHICVNCMQKKIKEYAERLSGVDYTKHDVAVVFAVHNELAEAIVRLNLKD